MNGLRIVITRYGSLYAWTVFDGLNVAASDLVPRLTRASARRAAERAAKRYLSLKHTRGPIREEFQYRGDA